jgi:hypothetical protein
MLYAWFSGNGAGKLRSNYNNNASGNVSLTQTR